MVANYSFLKLGELCLIIIMDKLVRYFSDTVTELKQVSWPTSQQALMYTILVMLISVIVAVYIGFFDILFVKIISFLKL